MKSHIEKWVWIASNDLALEFVYFVESLGTEISFEEIYKYCNLKEKLQLREIMKTEEYCSKLAVDYVWKNKKIEDRSSFADAILTLSLILIDCYKNEGFSDLTVFVGAETTIQLNYEKENIEVLIDSLKLLETYTTKFFGFSFYAEEDKETKEAKTAIGEIIEELKKTISN